MNNEALPPKVAEALDEIDDCMRMDSKVVPTGAINVVRAELLRLANDLAVLKARIAEAPVYEIPLSKPKSKDGWARVIESVRNERSVRGKRVRLVVEE